MTWERGDSRSAGERWLWLKDAGGVIGSILVSGKQYKCYLNDRSGLTPIPGEPHTLDDTKKLVEGAHGKRS